MIHYFRSDRSVSRGLLVSICLSLPWSLELNRSQFSIRTPRYSLNLFLFQMGLNDFEFLIDILFKAFLRLTFSQEHNLLTSRDVWRNRWINRAGFSFLLWRHFDLFLQLMLGFLYILILNKLLSVFELKILILFIRFVELLLHRFE